MEAQKLTAGQVHETLYDGVDVPVTCRDGRVEAVKVRKISRQEMAQYSILIAAAGGDEADECAFYVEGRDVAWARSLDDDSFDRVLAEGQRLNFTRFANWFERQSRKIKLVKQHSEILAQATEILERSPILSRLLGSTNGSSRKDIETGTSGSTRPTN